MNRELKWLAKTWIFPSLCFYSIVFFNSLARAEEMPFSSNHAFILDGEDDSTNVGGPGSDQGYTGGYRFSYLSTLNGEPWWLHPLTIHPEQNPQQKQNTFGISISQLLFTPINIYMPAPIYDDRPYAAWSYLGFSSNYQTDTQSFTLEMDLGIVGPEAGGEHLQNGIHEILGDPQAAGWANQLSTEPTLQFFYQQRQKSLQWTGTDKNKDIISYYGIAFGNVYISANVGAYMRYAWGLLPDDFGPTRATTQSGDSTAHLQTSNNNSGLYVFAGLMTNFVGRNLFLDGNTFRSSLHVTKYPVVLESDFGVGKQFRSWGFAWHFVTDSPEFSERSAFHSYASLSINYVY